MLGYAYQRGLIPIGDEALERAIELNGTAVPMNIGAFRWGRRAAAERAAVELLVAPQATGNIVTFARAPKTVDEIVASRIKHLTGYQNAALAERYRALVDRVRAIEQRDIPGQTALAEAVARNYAKLLAYKDEYEVARLFTEAGFAAQLGSQFCFQKPWPSFSALPSAAKPMGGYSLTPTQPSSMTALRTKVRESPCTGSSSCATCRKGSNGTNPWTRPPVRMASWRITSTCVDRGVRVGSPFLSQKS
jgi:hypothetical protein